MRNESHHIFSIIQENERFVKEYMKRFREEKLEIVHFPNTIMIKAFRRVLLRSSNLFVELTKYMPHIMEETYDEARKLRHGKKGKLVM